MKKNLLKFAVSQACNIDFIAMCVETPTDLNTLIDFNFFTEALRFTVGWINLTFQVNWPTGPYFTVLINSFL